MVKNRRAVSEIQVKLQAKHKYLNSKSNKKRMETDSILDFSISFRDENAIFVKILEDMGKF